MGRLATSPLQLRPDPRPGPAVALQYASLRPGQLPRPYVRPGESVWCSRTTPPRSCGCPTERAGEWWPLSVAGLELFTAHQRSGKT